MPFEATGEVNPHKTEGQQIFEVIEKLVDRVGLEQTPKHIRTGNGAQVGSFKKILVIEDITFTALEVNGVNVLVTSNLTGESLPAGTELLLDNPNFFTTIHIASGRALIQ